MTPLQSQPVQANSANPQIKIVLSSSYEGQQFPQSVVTVLQTMQPIPKLLLLISLNPIINPLDLSTLQIMKSAVPDGLPRMKALHIRSIPTSTPFIPLLKPPASTTSLLYVTGASQPEGVRDGVWIEWIRDEISTQSKRAKWFVDVVGTIELVTKPSPPAANPTHLPSEPTIPKFALHSIDPVQTSPSRLYQTPTLRNQTQTPNLLAHTQQTLIPNPSSPTPPPANPTTTKIILRIPVRIPDPAINSTTLDLTLTAPNPPPTIIRISLPAPDLPATPKLRHIILKAPKAPPAHATPQPQEPAQQPKRRLRIEDLSSRHRLLVRVKMMETTMEKLGDAAKELKDVVAGRGGDKYDSVSAAWLAAKHARAITRRMLPAAEEKVEEGRPGTASDDGEVESGGGRERGVSVGMGEMVKKKRKRRKVEEVEDIIVNTIERNRKTARFSVEQLTAPRTKATQIAEEAVATLPLPSDANLEVGGGAAAAERGVEG